MLGLAHRIRAPQFGINHLVSSLSPAVLALIIAAVCAGSLLAWLIWGARPQRGSVAVALDARPDSSALSAAAHDVPIDEPSSIRDALNGASPNGAASVERRRDGVVALARMERYFGAPSNEFVEPGSGRMDSAAAAAQAATSESAEAVVNADEDVPPCPLPSPTDDLKRIRGIGPTGERRLHELGICTFQALADLDEEAFEHVRRVLGRRSHQESWIQQALGLIETDETTHLARNGSKPA